MIKRMERRSILLCFIIVLMFAMVACGNVGDEISAADAYLEAAQKLIDDGAIDSAIAILEKGIDETGDDALIDMRNLVQKLTASQPTATTQPIETMDEISVPETQEDTAELAQSEDEFDTIEENTESVDDAIAEEEEETFALSKDNQQRINIFLSNFAEQCFVEYPVADDYFLLQFAYTYSQINSPGLISYTDYSACMSKSDVDSILNRFFGKTVVPSDNSMIFSHPMSPEDSIAYGANTYEFVAATGEFRGYVAIVYDMEKNSNGTYDVLFDIYTTESDSLSKYYEMTAEEAERSNGLSLYQHGSATVKDYTRPNGKETYQLISYSVY